MTMPQHSAERGTRHGEEVKEVNATVFKWPPIRRRNARSELQV